MQYVSQEPQVGRRTTESLRVHARNVAIRLKDAINRVASDDGRTDVDASSHLVSLCGNLDQLDHVVRTAIGMHSPPVPPELIALHARIGASVDAAMDLAGRAFDENRIAFAKSASNALVKVQSLLAVVETGGKASVSAGPPPMHSFRPKTGT